MSEPTLIHEDELEFTSPPTKSFIAGMTRAEARAFVGFGVSDRRAAEKLATKTRHRAKNKVAKASRKHNRGR